MSNQRVIWKYQAILLSRNKALLAGLFFLFLAGLYGARYGKHFVEQQRNVLYSVDTLEKANLEKTIKAFKKADTTKVQFASSKYYQTARAGYKTLIYYPSAFASLSVGQKDNFPFYHEVGGWTQDIYSVTTTDIQNPVKLMSGNFDLAFVFIYLFPLFIIALGYNVLSSEKENGSFTLLRVQTSVKRLVWYKLTFLASVMVLLSLVLNLTAFIVNGIDFRDNLPQIGSWITICICYILFWFALVYFVVSLRQSGATSALALGGLWIILLLLVPSIVHRNVSSSHEKELVQSIFNGRGDFPHARDLEPQQLADSFQRLHHPYPFPSMSDTGKAAADYYRGVMISEIQTRNNNTMGRMVMETQAAEYRRTMALNWLNPVFAVQNAFNQVAETEINNFHNYMKAVEDYQTQRRYFLYGYSINGKDFKLPDFYKIPSFDFRQPVTGIPAALVLLLPVLVITVLLVVLADGRKTKSRPLRH